jgi:hypothetical protein
MMAETIAQANHCFSISAKTKCTHPSNTNDVFSSPEMVNAVICPESGKSLKHQELITNLRHKLFIFNVIYFNCAFTKLIVPKLGNRTLATLPGRENWVMARLSHSCSQFVGLIAVTVTTVSVVFCIVQI